MVAYSFHAMFAPAVEANFKRQTVRADRRRHARVGEAVQLYAAMRTRQCRKLVNIDPICVEVAPIRLVIDRDHPQILVSIDINGSSLNSIEIEQFAWADGFGALPRSDGGFYLAARIAMGEYWLGQHRRRDWEGVLIRWEHRDQ